MLYERWRTLKSSWLGGEMVIKCKYEDDRYYKVYRNAFGSTVIYNTGPDDDGRLDWSKREVRFSADLSIGFIEYMFDSYEVLLLQDDDIRNHILSLMNKDKIGPKDKSKITIRPKDLDEEKPHITTIDFLTGSFVVRPAEPVQFHVKWPQEEPLGAAIPPGGNETSYTLKQSAPALIFISGSCVVI